MGVKRGVWRRRRNPETLLTRGVRDTLGCLGVFHWKQHQGLGSPPGVPDIIGILTVRVDDLVRAGADSVGIFLACEVKTEKGRLSDAQRAFLESVRNAGGVAFVARGPDDVLAELKKWRGIKWTTRSGQK